MSNPNNIHPARIAILRSLPRLSEMATEIPMECATAIQGFVLSAEGSKTCYTLVSPDGADRVTVVVDTAVVLWRDVTREEAVEGVHCSDGTRWAHFREVWFYKSHRTGNPSHYWWRSSAPNERLGSRCAAMRWDAYLDKGWRLEHGSEDYDEAFQNANWVLNEEW